jgi:uncharacterized protein (DUF2147 family)
MSLVSDDHHVHSVRRPSEIARVRDTAVQTLRDVTIAVALAATAAVGLLAWVSAATIPGTTDASGITGNAATGRGSQTTSEADDGFAQAPPARTQVGPGMAVSGGSR